MNALPRSLGPLGIAILTLSPSPAHADEMFVDFFGVALDAAGDMDDDGVPDLWIGDPSGSWTGIRTGRAWLVSGRTREALLEIPAPDGAQDFGWTLVAIDDVDGDGMRDVAIGAQFVATAEVPVRSKEDRLVGAGGVFLFSGADGAPLCAWFGPPDRNKIPWHTSGAGPSLASLGDQDGDGAGDLAIGWCHATGELVQQGRVDVVSGRSGAVLRSWLGDEAHDRFGFALAAVPDVDGDGKPDLAASAQQPMTVREGGGPDERPGYVRLLGSSGVEAFRAASPDGCRHFGCALSLVPATADEPALLAVGTWKSFCFHASDIQLLSPASGELVGVLPRPGPQEWGGLDPSESFGVHVLPLPRDLDRDGRPDLVVAAPDAFVHGGAGVVSRATGKPLRMVELGLRGELDLWGDPTPTHIGLAACTIGDLDGDGLDDFALGGASVRCGPQCMGTVVVCSGKTARTMRVFTRTRLGKSLEGR